MSVVTDFEKIYIIQIGCGGTGSWLVSPLSKFVSNVRSRVPIKYYLVDNDHVEERNILRQNFSNWDIGKSKTSALLNRFCYNDDDLTGITKKISSVKIFKEFLNNILEETKKILVIVIGCVDNNKTRKIIYKTLSEITIINYWHIPTDLIIKPPIVYIDSGNNLYNGQIITSWFNIDDMTISGKEQEPINFKKIFRTEKKQENVEGCVFFGDQSQAINLLSATLLFNSIQRIFTDDVLPPNLINFNSSGYSNFKI